MENKNVSTLLGTAEEANYKVQVLEEYKRNPFIEALPNIFSEDDVIDRFIMIPSITVEDKKRDVNIRYHILKRIKNFIQPLPIHFEIERKLATLIRRGYLARNPIDKTYLQRLRVINEIETKEFTNVLDDRLNFIRSTADSITIIGISGIGKSTAIERLLLMYPQVINHNFYEGRHFTRTQIVWLKIDCPYDGNLSTLCKSFFKSIDDLLGTNYLNKYGYLNKVTSTMLLHMTSLASLYGIGVLVIDEIQHLINSQTNQEEMLNFFVTLANTVGIPMVLIGTSKAQQLFRGNFRQARRAASDGAIIWDRMKENSEEWEFFLESLWDLQCLKEYSELDKQIKTVFYEETQGITSVAINLFILVQERIMFDEKLDKEKITPRILKKVAREDLKVLQPMLNAIRNNDIEAMYNFEDVMVNLDDLMLHHKYNTEFDGKVKDAMKERLNTLDFKRRDLIENLIIEFELIDIFKNIKSEKLRGIISETVENSPIETDISIIKKEIVQKALELDNKVVIEKVPTKVKNSVNAELPLLECREWALKKKLHPYEVLKDNNFIKPISYFN